MRNWPWEQELWNEFSAKGFADGTHYPVIGAVGMIRSGYGEIRQYDLRTAKCGNSPSWQNKQLIGLTNYFKIQFQTAIILSLSGGSEKNSYYVSLGYAKNNGLDKKNRLSNATM